AGRADHEQIVAAGGGDFERALGALLALDVLEVDQRAIDFAPATAAIEPSRPSSPSTLKPESASAGMPPIAAIRPSAIGRSSRLPSFGTSAGARLTVMRRAGSARPEATSAARTRSRASDTALSGRPTTLNAGSPGAT